MGKYILNLFGVQNRKSVLHSHPAQELGKPVEKWESVSVRHGA